MLDLEILRLKLVSLGLLICEVRVLEVLRLPLLINRLVDDLRFMSGRTIGKVSLPIGVVVLLILLQLSWADSCRSVQFEASKLFMRDIAKVTLLDLQSVVLFHLGVFLRDDADKFGDLRVIMRGGGES